MAQAVACAEAKVFLISPFVGRILDWHVKSGGGPYDSETDPGVVSVRSIYEYYRALEVSTIVMGASFRNLAEVEALAGCDRLTISPQLLGQLAKDDGVLTRKLTPTDPRVQLERIVLDERGFRWMMNEDAMATEKLAEGIRAFGRDLGSLRRLVGQRLATAA
jgi:transaldolase